MNELWRIIVEVLIMTDCEIEVYNCIFSLAFYVLFIVLGIDLELSMNKIIDGFMEIRFILAILKFPKI
jgi:hypothetical protein